MALQPLQPVPPFFGGQFPSQNLPGAHVIIPLTWGKFSKKKKHTKERTLLAGGLGHVGGEQKKTAVWRTRTPPRPEDSTWPAFLRTWGHEEELQQTFKAPLCSQDQTTEDSVGDAGLIPVSFKHLCPVPWRWCVCVWATGAKKSHVPTLSCDVMLWLIEPVTARHQPTSHLVPCLDHEH